MHNITADTSCTKTQQDCKFNVVIYHIDKISQVDMNAQALTSVISSNLLPK